MTRAQCKNLSSANGFTVKINLLLVPSSPQRQSSVPVSHKSFQRYSMFIREYIYTNNTIIHVLLCLILLVSFFKKNFIRDSLYK